MLNLRKKPKKYSAIEAARPKRGTALFLERFFAPLGKRLRHASENFGVTLSRAKALPLPQIPGGRRPLLLVFDIFMGLAVAASLLYCLFALHADDEMRNVSVSADGATVQFTAREASVSDFLSRSGFSLAQDDTLSQAGDTLLKDGMTIQIARAFPVAVESLSHVTLLRVTGGTVGQALDLAGVKLGVEDEVSNQPFEDVTPGMKIQHIDVEISYPYDPDDNLVPLYYREVTIKDDSMYNYKDPIVVQEGKNGLKEVTRRVITKNGVVVSRTIVDQMVIEPAVDEVVRVGTKVHYQTNYVGEWRTFNRHNIVRPSDGVNGWKKVTVHAVTGYCSGTRTSTGTRPKLGTIAVNPKLIPYYTQIYVPGYGYGTALDTGAFRNYSGEKSNAIDLWFNTEREAVRWGRKYNVTIYVKVG
ncbi:MAG TPA: G5 domain-containing protein [Clostridia bacterium]|nr:G5 domain-containing protein [Clostridia bacterium]